MTESHVHMDRDRRKVSWTCNHGPVIMDRDCRKVSWTCDHGPARLLFCRLQFIFFGNGNWHAGIKGNHVKGRQSGINCVRFADGSTITYELPGLIVKGRACLSQPQLRAVPKPG